MVMEHIFWENGDKYTGLWKEGVFDGQGVNVTTAENKDTDL